MTGIELNKILESMPELDSIQAVANYLIKTLHGRKDVVFSDIASIFVKYAKPREELHKQINGHTIVEEFIREYVTLINDIITGIYINDTRKFKYQCPSCNAKYEIKMTDEEYDRFIDLYYDPGIEDGYKHMDDDDMLWEKYRHRKCENCGFDYDIYPNIVINGVYTI